MWIRIFKKIILALFVSILTCWILFFCFFVFIPIIHFGLASPLIAICISYGLSVLLIFICAEEEITWVKTINFEGGLITAMVLTYVIMKKHYEYK